MKRILEYIKNHKYYLTLGILVFTSIVLSVTYSNYFVESGNHRVAEMYIGALKYSMKIDSNETNTLTVEPGVTVIDVDVNNLNPVDTYYKLLYLNNSNLEIKYFSETKDTDEVKTSYKSPNDSITSSNTNNLKLFIRNNSDTNQEVSFSLKGGYINNTLSDIKVPSGYSEITIDNSNDNTYFCKTSDTLTAGLEYVNGQYSYGYKKQSWCTNSEKYNWQDIDIDGWGVSIKEREDSTDVTSKLCTYINNKPIVTMAYMLACSSFNTVDTSSYNTSNVTDMNNMFFRSMVKSVDLSNFDTSNVTDMGGMFYSSRSLSTITGLENLNTSKVTSMSSMFSGIKVTTLDLSNFDTSNVIYMNSMFSGSQATTLDLSSFNTSNVAHTSSMFYNSTNLKTIYVSDKFNMDKVLTNNSTATIESTSKIDTYKVSTDNSSNMFYNCTSLVGGAGTKFDSTKINKEYARIDGGTSSPGYFTDVADKNISDPVSFSSDSFATIARAVKNGNISKYNVGDTKTIDMGSYGTHTLRIANTSTPSECSTSGFSQTACGFVIEFMDTVTTHIMNPSGTYNNINYSYGYNIGGWPNTEARTFINNDIYNSIPNDLRKHIIDTFVVSSHGKDDTVNFTSTDKLYLLSPKEVYDNYNDSDDSARSLTRQLDYYKNIGVNDDDYSAASKKNGSSAIWWWMRSATNSYNYNFACVGVSGQPYNCNASTTRSIIPAFRIG